MTSIFDRIRSAAFAALFAGLVAALSGCGGGGSDTAATASADPTATGVFTASTAPATTTSKAAPFDTSAVVAASRACLGGGCHEKNAALLDGYRQSKMTQANVKCNACHGTHTAAEVGQAKPNLTGYHAGMGATGYSVPKDRCVACHERTLQRDGHPHEPATCTGCHAPHAFAAGTRR
ncbi:MAG: hypothetical protein KF755_11210 [Burkholderiaceae bacterium]|nr:hypothetical protein [Burkholderiaceae bacterium]